MGATKQQHEPSYHWVHPASLTLLESGELEPTWLESFNRRASRILSSPPASIWACSDFVGLHFASLYLPLRLKVSRSTLGSAHADVQHVHERAEEVLWTAAISTEMGSLRPAEKLLVDLAFGDRRPPLGRPLAKDWCTAVAAGAEALRPIWASATSMAFWPALAAHYISFFLDFFFLGAPPIEAAALPKWLAHLDEATTLNLQDPIRVLRTWFAIPGPARDSSGLPATSSSRGPSRSTIPRTTLENLLLQTLSTNDGAA